MPPHQQPHQPTPPASQDPYNFILNPEQPKRSSSLGRPLGLLFIIGAVAVVAVLLVIVLSIARGSSTSSKPYLTVAQDQAEIGRVAGLDLDQVKEDRVKNFATTTKLTMATDSSTFSTYMARHGVKIASKQLLAGTNSATDAQLTSAISSNTLDATLRTVLQNELKDYQADLAKAYQSSTSSSTRAVLKQLNTNAQLLLTQSQQ